jgi:hypothetical protein
MVVIAFTKNEVLKGLKELTLFGEKIQFSTEVKYFGMTLDKGLIWVHSWIKSQIESTGPFGSVKALLGIHGD